MLDIVSWNNGVHTVLRGGMLLCCIVEAEDGPRLEYHGNVISFTQLSSGDVNQILDYMEEIK